MSTDRVKCIECDNMILPSTAEKNDGLCAPCVSTPADLRQKTREFKEKVESGQLQVSNEQLSNSKNNQDLNLLTQIWSLDSEYYNDQTLDKVDAQIEKIRSKDQDSLHLYSNNGSRINFVFNKEYSVCEYHDEEFNDFVFVYNENNATNQVSECFQLEQSCPCCGVGIFTYSSHCHMPRNQGFKILYDILGKQTSGINYKWLELDDLSYVSPGFG